MKKFITTLILSVMFIPTAFAAAPILSDDGTMLVEPGHATNVSCTWYLPNYRHMLADWSSHVNDQINVQIARILGR